MGVWGLPPGAEGGARLLDAGDLPFAVRVERLAHQRHLPPCVFNRSKPQDLISMIDTRHVHLFDQSVPGAVLE